MELNVREIQQESLKILKVIDKIAKQEKLQYVLFFGSLLGAVRHKGFIPWDDDLDILMFRPDYEKLKSYFISHQSELEPFEFFCPEFRKDYPYMIGRICNTNFSFVADAEKDCGMGTFVDIYPIDGAGNGKHKFTYYESCLLTTIYALKNKTHFIRPFSKMKVLIKGILFFLCRLFPYAFLQNKLRHLSTKFTLASSEYVACMSWMDGGKPVIFKKEDLEKTVLIDFEDGKYPVVKNYEDFLQQLYGDYMQFPPENERVGHHYYKIFPKTEAKK